MLLVCCSAWRGALCGQVGGARCADVVDGISSFRDRIEPQDDTAEDQQAPSPAAQTGTAEGVTGHLQYRCEYEEHEGHLRLSDQRGAVAGAAAGATLSSAKFNPSTLMPGSPNRPR